MYVVMFMFGKGTHFFDIKWLVADYFLCFKT